MPKLSELIAQTPQAQVQPQTMKLSQVMAQTPTPEQYEAAKAEFMPREEPVKPRMPSDLLSPMPALEAIGEMFSGSERETRATQELPELESVWHGVNIDPASAASKASAALTATNPEELADIIISADPKSLAKQYDEKGNIIVANNKTGARAVVNKPGLSKTDVLQFLGLGAAFTPSGRATTIPRMGVSSALTQGAIEALQAGEGGEVNPADVAIAGGAAMAIPAIAQQAKKALGPIAQAVPEQQAVTPPLKAAESIAETAKAAATGSKSAAEKLASEAAPDLELKAAAERLGISDYLQPDHVTTSQAYRQLAMAIKSIPGSEARAAELQGLEQVAKRAESLVDEAGGMRDLSQLSDDVKGALQSTQKRLMEEADTLYKQLADGIPAKTEVVPSNVIDFISGRADDLGGKQHLSKMEQTILQKLAPAGDKKPTYALLDQVRKDIGAAAYKNEGPFKDAESGLLRKLYDLIGEDQSVVANSLGKGEIFAAAKQAVSARKGIEDDLAALYGKQLSESMVGKLGTATSALAKGDAEKFINLINSVPNEQRQQVAASALIQGFGKSARDGLLNFNSFAKWYRDVKGNSKAYAALTANLPKGSIQSLDDLYKIANGIQLSQREFLATGKGTSENIKRILNESDGVIAGLYDLAKRSAGGATTEAITTPLGMPGAGLSAAVASAMTKGKRAPIVMVDKMLASPEFIDLARKGVSPERTAKLAKSGAFKAFMRSLSADMRAEIERTGAEKWITNLATAQAPTINDQGGP